MSVFRPPKPIKLNKPLSLTSKPFVRNSKGYGSARIVRDRYGADWWSVRAEVVRRDKGLCQDVGSRGGICGKPGVDVHHIIPLSRGGCTEKSNLILVCQEHHEARHKHMRK